MIKILSATLLGVLVLAQQPQGKVTESELGTPGAPAPPPRQAAPPETSSAPTPEPNREPQQTTPLPTPAPEPEERERSQAGKPVAAFWTVMPGR